MRDKPRSQSANGGLLNQQQEPLTRRLLCAVQFPCLGIDPQGAKFKIEFRSRVLKGKKKHGVNPTFLRMIANGLLNGPLRQ